MRSPSCFILAPAGAGIGELVALVEDAGWAALNGESIRPGTDAYLASTVDLIQRSEAVLVLIGTEADPNLLVQTGMALGFGTPVLLIGTDRAVEENGWPDRVLAGLPRVNATLSDRDALRFHVTAFLDAQRPGKAAVPLRSLPSQFSSRAVASIAPPHSKLEERILDALTASIEVEAVRSQPRLSGDASFIPDFALWIRDPRGDFGSLVLLEFTGSLAVSEKSQRQVDRLRAYAASSGVRTVFHVQGLSTSPLKLIGAGPWTFEAGVDPFVEELRRGNLVHAMTRERNRFVHSAG
jgi:hypothetical protein